MSKLGVVNIKGKDYKTVALRVQEFREKFPNYFLTTEIVKIDDEQCIVKAYAGVHLEGGGAHTFATGHAQEFRKASQINGTSYVENCETSAIGRCLACLGIGGQEFASANEVVNAIYQQNNPVQEVLTAEQLEVAKNMLDEASKRGELKQAFFKLTPAYQEKLREYANDLKKSA
jgi:hypothetical protein